LVNPILLPNEAAEIDLRQRDYVIDSVNGYDFVQTGSEGVPVLVNPILLTNQAAEIDLRQRDYIMDGINGFEFVQQGEPEESMTLQVNGVPVVVNPESMMDNNEYSSRAKLGFEIRMGPDDLKLQQKSKPNDSVTL